MSDLKRKRDLVHAAKSRAKRKALPFSLHVDDIQWPDRCPALGIVLDYGPKGRRGGELNSPSLDRLDPGLGYVPDNVRVVSRLANTIKSSAESWAIRKVADWLQEVEGIEPAWHETVNERT